LTNQLSPWPKASQAPLSSTCCWKDSTLCSSLLPCVSVKCKMISTLSLAHRCLFTPTHLLPSHLPPAWQTLARLRPLPSPLLLHFSGSLFRNPPGNEA
jgi:hypothetical protein